MTYQQVEPIKLLVVIVDRGKGERIVSLCEAVDVTYHLIARGYGAANSEILEVLGLGETEKDIVLCAVLREKVGDLLKTIEHELELKSSGKGIAFTVAIKSVDGLRSYKYLAGVCGKRCENHGKDNAI